MAVFAAVAAALAVVVLALLLQPLWRASRTTAFGIAIAALVATAALYQLVGTPAALDPRAAATPKTLAEAITQLEAELRRDPKQRDGWRLLGQAYTTEQRYADAREAYAKAAALSPQEPDVLVEAAQARAMAAPERRFDAPAVALLQRALEAQPRHQRARWFLGVAQRQAGQSAQAARTWEALLAQVDAPTAASLRPQIDAARADAGLPPLPGTATATAQGLTVNVQLDPDLAARVRLRGDASVFIIARAVGGAPMPVAVEKRSARELPLTVTLDDADSLMPTQTLSALREVDVTARISASGDATPRAGDLEAQPVRVRLPADAPVGLTIGTARE